MNSDYAFSPLSLTQVLPFLPLSQTGVDYEVSRREDPQLISELLSEASTQILLVRGGRVAVPRGLGDAIQSSAVKLRAALLPGTYLREPLAAMGSRALVVFLGSRESRSYLSLALPSADTPASDSLLAEMLRRFDWVDLRDFAPRASALEAGLATSAVTVSTWQQTQRFCPQCGARVEFTNAGWAQKCTNPDHGAILFPRIEPAVITAVVDRDDRLLLQHNIAWKNPKLLSVSAGFVEAGENLEHAVRRETMEEVGIRLGDMTYTGSQPWPFQRSLMVAFKARALSTDIHVDGVEVGSARWLDRDEFTFALANGEFELPTKAAVARYQIQEWYGQEL